MAEETPAGQAFIYQNERIRTIEIEHDIWFVGKDVATILGYKDTVNTFKNTCFNR